MSKHFSTSTLLCEHPEASQRGPELLSCLGDLCDDSVVLAQDLFPLDVDLDDVAVITWSATDILRDYSTLYLPFGF